ncbi:uncharacterized protein LOC132869041 [Neoarius graeffei]|uniref:uncharacterized protein LOC132869041 n=1 Tax=Neoarius graeffei TaxID=443677 RepID=UPI00298CAA16|nr:uncharacterized protein LOC132869041 [Neoarius graeffei]
MFQNLQLYKSHTSTQSFRATQTFTASFQRFNLLLRSKMNSNSAMTSLYVGDLHHEVTEMMLVEMVSRAGPIHSVHMCRDKKTFSSRGYTFVNFLHRADAERALESVPAVETAAVGDSSPVVVPVSAAKELPATTDAVPPTAVSPVSEVPPDKDATVRTKHE